MKPQNQPIGYWVKKVDDLLTRGIDEIQSSFRLTRTDWQILNVIAERGKINNTELATLIKPFADLDVVNNILIKFGAAGLLTENHGNLALTEKGNDLYTACFEKQKIFRQKAVQGISEQQYHDTIITLQKIAENLSE